MRLIDDWRAVLTRSYTAHAVGFNIALQVGLALMPDPSTLLPWWGLLAIGLGGLALIPIARIIKQRSVSGEGNA